MKTLMLDTSAYAAFRRGHSKAVAHIQRAAYILMPATVLGELLGGFAYGNQPEKNRAELHALLQSPRVSTPQINLETAERYAVIYKHLRSTDSPIPTNDLWIAASAMEHSAHLLTFDKHFLHISQIISTVLTWSD